MTIGLIIVIVLGVIVGIVGTIWGISAYLDGEQVDAIIIIVIALITCAIMIIGSLVYSHTEAGKRDYKDQQSNFGGGIERTIKVYDINGNLIQEYEGTFDIETDTNSNYILFDDSLGKRHIIYNTTGTVLIDEK